MKVAQLHTLLNSVTSEILGKENVLSEDLRNIVDVGKEIVNANQLDNYVNKLVNKVGKTQFNNRLYRGGVPSVLMDNWEYGSILEKISADLPEAEENDTWKLQDGKSYDPNVFHQPKVNVKFFNRRITFEIPLSFTEKQVKESFQSVNQLNGFISMLTISVENAITVKTDALIMRTINNMIGETLSGEGNEVRAVNLLEGFNKGRGDGEQLTPSDAVYNSDFIKYSTYIMGLYADRLSRISTLFNVGGKERFTPKDALHTVLLSDFAKAINIYLRADLHGDQNAVALPNFETVPYWQASGLNYEFADTSKIDVKTSTNKDVSQGGILGVMFDRQALGVSNLDKRVTSNYNPKAEFYTNFNKISVSVIFTNRLFITFSSSFVLYKIIMLSYKKGATIFYDNPFNTVQDCY